jgi:hypothetical protein
MDRFGSVMRANCVQLLLCERARPRGAPSAVIPAKAGIQPFVQQTHDVQKNRGTSHPAVKNPAFAGVTIVVGRSETSCSIRAMKR